MLRIHVISASNLINVDTFGKSDAYVRCLFRGRKLKTSVIKDELDPEWNQSLEWDLEGKPINRNDTLEITVKDEDLTRDKLLGRVDLQLRNVVSGAGKKDLDLSLLDKDNQQTSSKLKLRIEYSAPVISCAQQEKSTADSSPKTTSESNNPEFNISQTSASPMAAIDGIAKGSTSPLATMSQGSRPGDSLPAVETRFQVRVKVIEARQLMGENIYPSCRVQIGDQAKSTSVQTSTNSPWFNEIFFFFIEMKPNQIWNLLLELKICNSRMQRSKNDVGSFKIEVGTVYNQPQHAIINKWFALASQDELDTSIKGYLKASIAVMAPRDECPEMKCSLDDDDVESNLIMTSQINRVQTTFNVNVYQAEDLPRMDVGTMSKMKSFFRLGETESKHYVDPYVKISFAGWSSQTQIEMNNSNPTFMERLYIGSHLPTFAKYLQIDVKDWDRANAADSIARCVIPMASISTTNEDGFLPTFGPTFVNLYGSPREFSALSKDKDEQMNEGKLEGCAYRGRLLISLETNVGQLPIINSDPISDEQKLRIDGFLKRKSYFLHCSFEDAGMISELNSQVEFEVSMGSYGNKFEDSQMPSPSFTQPTNPIFDGCRYYYLPWQNDKPYVTVPCQWEDISCRLFTVNMLLKAAEQLEKSSHVLLNMMKRQSGLSIMTTAAEKMLKQAMVICSEPLPVPDVVDTSVTELDRHLYGKRCRSLQNIVKELSSLLDTMVIEEIADNMEKYSITVKQLAEEPQSSMPDIIIWMMSDKKRIAYARVPAHSILHADIEIQKGYNCGRIQTLPLKYPGGGQRCDKIPALLRFRMWLGKKTENREWLRLNEKNETIVYAETYENQTSIAGNWVTKGPLMTRPSWSDAEGDLKLIKEDFEVPEGWQFDGDWFINPEPSLFYEADAGHSSFLEDVFENELRLPGGEWTPDLTHWSDVRKDPATPRDERDPPPGWQWDDAWQVDYRRAVDDDGWEYCIEASLGGYGPVQKLFHLNRRRRWISSRTHTSNTDQQEDMLQSEGWAYASFFGQKFHARERRVDMVRRRRWHRKMAKTSTCEAELPIFLFKSDDTKNKLMVGSPMLYIRYSEHHTFQVRAHIYQARDLHSGDKSGQSDPYACASFMKCSSETVHQKNTLCPIWDETLIINNITLFGELEEIVANPPPVLVEIFDHDSYGEPEFLGRVTAFPHVHLKTADPPELQWYHITSEEQQKGELLASFEAYHIGDCDIPPLPTQKRDGTYSIPTNITPKLQRTAIEILCWGVRNMKRYNLTTVQKPTVEFECAGIITTSDVLDNVKEHPNFSDPFLFMEVMLPQNALYLPPLSIKIRDKRMFGENPEIGSHIVKSLDLYRIEPSTLSKSLPQSLESGTSDNRNCIAVEMSRIYQDMEQPVEIKNDDEFDWWSKYYASTGEMEKCGEYLQKGYERMKIYHVELEKVSVFGEFRDILETFPLMRGKTTGYDESQFIGEFKGTFRVYPLPEDRSLSLPPRQLRGLPSSESEELVVRVYIVRCRDLSPMDPNGSSDPYIKVTLGDKQKNNRENYCPKTVSPVFGICLEFPCSLPRDKELTVSVLDYDLMSKDDLIGETTIDLENRYLTKFRAMCGLQRQYHLYGPNRWRDTMTPRQILDKVCDLHNWPQPNWISLKEVAIGQDRYTLSQMEDSKQPKLSSLGPDDERLALSVLHTFDLVPEHVETRKLINPSMPDLEQGKIEMFVEMFAKQNPSPIVDITPRTPTKYVVRVVVYNVHEVLLQEYSAVSGANMSDVYVKCGFQGIREHQNSDIHFRCMDGEAMFNWRFVFEIDYLEAERMMIHKSKERLWSLDETELRLPPRLLLQLWDNDVISKDDKLGELQLDLCRMIAPARSVEKCQLSQWSAHQDSKDNDNNSLMTNGAAEKKKLISVEQTSEKTVDMWKRGRIRGFWPAIARKENENICAGKLELEIEVLSAEEAETRPAGRGREEPNLHPKLEPPQRPATSFLWLSSPWKSFRYILWGRHKWHIITFFIVVLLILFLLLALYSLPGAAVDKLMGL